MRKAESIRKTQGATESCYPRHEIFSPVLTLFALAVLTALTVLAICGAPMKAEESADQLAVCQAKLNSWENWARDVSANTAPKGFQTFENLDRFLAQSGKISLDEELLAENRRLRDRNRRLEDLRHVIWPGSMVLAGSAIGFYLLFLAIRSLRRIPISQARKQLFVLIGGATWVTLGILVNSGQIECHPASAVAGAFLWSLPGLFFAGILLWWYGQKAQNAAIVAHPAVTVPPADFPIVLHGEKISPETATNSAELQQTLGYGTMWERLKAYICDFAVIFMILGAFILGGGPLEALAIVGMALLVGYMVLSQSIFHTTVGKYLFGLELRSASHREMYPSFWAVLIRETGGRFVSMLFAGVGYWAWVRRPQNQAWSDRIAGTVVVRRTTTPRMRKILGVVVVVSLLFTIALYIAYIHSLASRF